MAELIQTDEIARLVHESGREAVEKRQIYRDDLPVKPFAEWAELTPQAQEGRRMMARYLISKRDYLIPLLQGTPIA